jgi:hypothetical protein
LFGSILTFINQRKATFTAAHGLIEIPINPNSTASILMTEKLNAAQRAGTPYQRLISDELLSGYCVYFSTNLGFAKKHATARKPLSASSGHRVTAAAASWLHVSVQLLMGELTACTSKPVIEIFELEARRRVYA